MSAILAGIVGLLFGLAISHVRVSFYAGYFRQKQINAGKDPDEVLRQVFPFMWRIIR